MASSFCTRATDVPVLKKPQKFLKIAQAINLLKNNLKSRQNFGLLSRKFCCQKSPNLVTLSLSFCVIITQAMGGGGVTCLSSETCRDQFQANVCGNAFIFFFFDNDWKIVAQNAFQNSDSSGGGGEKDKSFSTILSF